MKVKRYAGRLLYHPLFVVPPLAILLVLGWQRYTFVGLNISQPRPGANILVSAKLRGQQQNWQAAGPSAVFSLRPVHGYETNQAQQLHITSITSGDVVLTSPRVAVQPQHTYLYKAYYRTDVPFTLLVHYFYADGSDTLTAVQDYDAEKGVWSTASAAFNGAANVRSVQFVYRLSDAGMLTVDGAYLQTATDVVAPPPQGPSAGSQNLIPNAQLAANGTAMPDDWTPYQEGNAVAAFSDEQDSGGRFVQTTIHDYVNGEAKWQYTPVPVQADQYYMFTASYKSDRPVDVVAEYEHADGGRSFETLDTVQPAGSWTHISYPVQIPSGTSTLMITLVSHGNGTTAVRGYSLVDHTRSGVGRWNRPLVSITFDDGWQSSYDYALPVLNGYGYKSTFYVNPQSIETPNFMTAAELHNLVSGGHEIAAHGYSHDDMSAISADHLDYQLQQGQVYLANAGFPTHDVAAPYGKIDAQVTWYAKKYYQTLRGTETGVNTRQNIDPYDLKVYYVDNTTPPQAIAQMLSQAQQSNGWLILVYHRIGADAKAVPPLKFESATITLSSLKAQLALVHKSGITVKTVQGAYKEVEAE